MPSSLDPIFEFLEQFKGDTGRYRLEYFRYLKDIFQHAVRVFGFPRNPLEGIKSPLIKHKPIRTLRLDQFAKVNLTPQDINEAVVWQLLGGHGWRQIEVRRIAAGDARSAAANADALIFIKGKEREEYGPILSETLSLLVQLADNLADDEFVLRSHRMRRGRNEALGEKGLRDLIQRLFARAEVDYKGHDLRRTFCTLVRKASDDNESLAMRLIRDRCLG